MEARSTPLARGLLSFAVRSAGARYRFPPSSSADARYCYSMFLRHFSHIAMLTGGVVPRRVAELGPGSSLGMGLAALLAGAETYRALDIIDHTDPARDLAVLDTLIGLFAARAPVPADGVNRDTFPPPRDWAFPPALAARLDALLAPERVAAIRADTAERGGRFLRLVAPWTSAAVGIGPGSIDWIFSHAVLAHVDDLEAAHACFSAWIATGGLMTHAIDYTSHRTTVHWNGHWTVGDGLWRLIRGRRPYLLNRMPHSAYLGLANRHGFAVLAEIELAGAAGLPQSRFAPRFREMADRDAGLAEAMIVSRAVAPTGHEARG